MPIRKIRNSQQQDKSASTKITKQQAQNWKKAAQKLGRSPSHIKKIEGVIHEAPQTTVDNKPGITLDRKDALAMKKDRADFGKLNLENQQSKSRGLRR